MQARAVSAGNHGENAKFIQDAGVGWRDSFYLFVKGENEMFNDTHTVFKNTDAQKYLTEEEKHILGVLLSKIETGRIMEGKQSNSYWICNHDEPYAEDVKTVILAGEGNKATIPPFYKKKDGKYIPKPVLTYNGYIKMGVNLETE